MPDPENFAGYDAVIVSMLKNDPSRFEAFFLDVNCRYGPHFLKYHPEWAALIPRMLIGWLHSKAGHNVNCQLQHSGVYQELMGRAIGEQPEQLWVSLWGHKCVMVVQRMWSSPCTVMFLI